MVKEKPDFLFETSWEVCNKVGGIHTVIASKMQELQNYLGEQVVYVGPDIWKNNKSATEFIEENLFEAWQHKAKSEGLRIRTGYWDIPGRPKVILVDFTPFIAQKDKILTDLWNYHKVDSISGGWEYVESVLFGYAVGKVIESYTNFVLPNSKVTAHFHEWMTCSGVLYLNRNATHISTVFTTHATSLGRSICSNNQNLYQYLAEGVSTEDKAKELNIFAKHSLEKTAAHTADAFTTVSELTARECEVLLEKKVDCVLPNGFRNVDSNTLPQTRKKARETLLKVTEALTGNASKDTIFVGTGGRYEFRNKGLDLFIDALANLKQKDNLQRDVVAFMFIPGNFREVNKELEEKLGGKDLAVSNRILTHEINYPEQDAILNSLKYHQFYNNSGDRVKMILAPVYLNGNDGIFNLNYYDLLAGCDLSLFPSYYEPWGYTPLESVAFGVPTLTTNLAGFGIWAKDKSTQLSEGVQVVKRGDHNYLEVAEEMALSLLNFVNNYEGSEDTIRNNALHIAAQANWSVFFKNYQSVYYTSLQKLETRKNKIVTIKQQIESRIVKEMELNNTPNWKKLVIQSDLPDNLKKLDELSMNLWWVWNNEATELFEEINPEKWEDVRKNPVALLKAVNSDRFKELSKDEKFIKKLDEVHATFKNYMSLAPSENTEHVAYFSMEYGLTNILRTFSGGLGMLAGDYLKEASDSNTPMVAVGFMYRYGYFTQRLSTEGDQIPEYEAQVFSELPVTMLRDENKQAIKVGIPFPGRTVYARIWLVEVGRVKLYLLDTDTNSNNEQDKAITHQLYGGDWDNRMKQEILLGIGGTQLIRSLNVNANIFHLNEGHAAFCNLDRLTHYIENENLNFDEALEVVRSSSLFTTHTPVPAGHDTFSEDTVRTYLRHYPERLHISWEAFLSLGRFNGADNSEKFSMSVFAAKTSQEINGVSKLHGAVSRDMFKGLWNGYAANELSLGHVTNGVHYPSWTAREWKKLHVETFGADFMADQSNKEIWSKIYNLADSKVWETRNTLRTRLINYIKGHFTETWIRRHEDPQTLVEIQNNLSDKVLTLGFARRFATYKRAHLLFTDKARLSRLLNNPEKPVQILFAGKAHPADGAGQKLIKDIVEISRLPEFTGKILFLENYDMELGKRLVSGVDVWVNNPTRPLEASGTSGQKAEMNGVLNFSVLDGWWVEGYKEKAGWALPEERTYQDQSMQDKLDAATIYYMLENEVIPLFYDRDENGVPVKWIQYVKKSFAEIAPEFTTKRMIDDYKDRFYSKLHSRAVAMRANKNEMAIELANWKRKIQTSWDSIEVVSVEFPNTLQTPYKSGEQFKGTVVLDLKELAEEQIGVEMVYATKKQAPLEVFETRSLNLVKKEGTKAYYQTEFELKSPGVYDYGLRIFPINEKLPHRQDFAYIKWI